MRKICPFERRLSRICAQVVLAALFWVGAVAVLQRMGKADPLLRQVYLRHIRYEDWYPAKSGIYSASVQPPMKWK
jgi:hypothetical protein